MFKKFTEGLMFGGGFAISFVVVWYIAAYLIAPMFITSKIEEAANMHFADPGAGSLPSTLPGADTGRETAVPFHEMSLEDQIKHASVIALAGYEPSADGRMKAVIREFLKKESGAVLYYNVGDEYPSASYYPKANRDYGDGLVIFFVGSPAAMRMSMSYSGDRIRGLGDLPVELLKKKCKAGG